MYGESTSDNWTTCVSFNDIIGSFTSSLRWGKITIDDTPVASNCCRLYQQPEFKLHHADAGYVDKCLVWSEFDTFDLDDDQPGMSSVQSYRCGDSVLSTFDTQVETSSASGGATN